jgi:hypothetical protein
MVQEQILSRQQELVDGQAAGIRKKRRELLDQIQTFCNNIEEKGRGELNGFANWNMRQLGDHLQYRKNDSDKAMPKKVEPL